MQISGVFFLWPICCQAFGSFKLRDAVPDLADNSWFQAGWGSHGFRVGYCFFFLIISNNISTSTMGIYKKKWKEQIDTYIHNTYIYINYMMDFLWLSDCQAFWYSEVWGRLSQPRWIPWNPTGCGSSLAPPARTRGLWWRLQPQAP